MRASRPAMMASPQPNAAMVSSMPGLVNGEKAMTIAGKEKTIWDGIVLRATRIKANGTLVIPPAGLYTTARSGNWRPFDNEPSAWRANLCITSTSAARATCCTTSP